MTWEVLVDGQRVRVCGFKKAKKARSHAKKHFLRAAERWVDLKPARPPAEFTARLREGAEPEHVVLDQAAAVYTGLVEEESTKPRAAARWGYYVPPGQDRGFAGLVVATPRGVFCAFASSRGRVSGLATAFRPLPARRNGPVTLQQFHQEAHRRVLRNF